MVGRHAFHGGFLLVKSYGAPGCGLGAPDNFTGALPCIGAIVCSWHTDAIEKRFGVSHDEPVSPSLDLHASAGTAGRETCNFRTDQSGGTVIAWERWPVARQRTT